MAALRAGRVFQEASIIARNEIQEESSHNHWNNFRKRDQRKLSLQFPAVWEMCEQFVFQDGSVSL